jgi:uncharacterized membrane protein
MPPESPPAAAPPDPGLVSYTNAMYALHALAALIGILGAHTIVGSFVFGLPSIVAIVMNYVRRSEVRGSYLESHFRWQRRTFWFALAWIVGIGLLSAPLMPVLVGFLTFGLGVAAIGVWVVYRVVRGWLALRELRALPMPAS